MKVATSADKPMKTTTTKLTLNLGFSCLKLHLPFKLLVSLQQLETQLPWPHLNCNIF